MSHLSMEQLIEVADGELADALQAHLSGCPACTAALAELEGRRQALRSLALKRPEGDLWRSIARRRRKSVWRRRSAGAALAVAACLIAFALVRHPQPPHPVPDALAPWVEESQALRTRLGALPEPVVLNVRQANTIADLEDQLALVDQLLARVPQSKDSAIQVRQSLWKTKVELLQSLLSVRTASAVVSR